jgi:SsrA-binding protein
MTVAAAKSAGGGEKVICVNKKARFEYEILESFEGGLVLQGTEVKSLRQGQASIREAFGDFRDGELYLVDCHVPPYTHGTIHNHEPTRPRKILLRRRELRRLQGKVAEKGLSLVPLRLYFRRGLAKVELALVRGKKLHDKRETLKRRQAEREMDREVRRHSR